MISQKYYIEFSKWFDDPARDIATSAVFKVYPDNISQAFSRNDFYFSIGITRTAYANQLYCLADEHAYAKFLLKLSIEKIIAILKSTDLVELDKRFEFIYHSENLPNPQKLLQKKCKYQEKEINGLYCLVAADNDKAEGRTTISVCEKCILPSEEIICSYLCHPLTKGMHGDNTLLDRVVYGYCEIGNDLNIRECIPGGKSCWKKIIEPAKEEAIIPNDISERLIEELDFVNLAFKDRFKAPLFNFSQARSILDISSECKSKEDFTHKIHAICDLVSRMNVAKLIDKEELNELKDKKVAGSINLFEHFLKNNFSDDFEIIRSSVILPLRKLHTIRKDYPTHSVTENLAQAFNGLGVEYPPLDWQEAYNKIMYATWHSLKYLRNHTMNKISQ